jgi:fatty acid desaturase
MSPMLGLKYRDALLPNLLALLYVAAGYVGGLYLMSTAMATGSVWVYVPALLWFAHALVVAAYLIHDCAHNTLFTNNERNAKLGRVLSWVVGACYSDYVTIRDKHFRHHVDEADVIAIDFRPHLRRHPYFLKCIHAMEWCYVPVCDWLMHLAAILVPFFKSSRRAQRWPALRNLLLRSTLFSALAYCAPWAALGYVIGYSLMLHVLRFMDAFQHTFDISLLLDEPRPPAKKNREYEQKNTFSNPQSLDYPWLNLLTLNFGFHNAHHEKPNEPWYRLPRLHRQLFDDPQQQVLPFRNLLSTYHRYRVQRVLNEDPPGMDVMSSRGKDFIGVVGVSFLTAF